MHIAAFTEQWKSMATPTACTSNQAEYSIFLRNNTPNAFSLTVQQGFDEGQKQAFALFTTGKTRAQHPLHYDRLSYRGAL